MPLPSLTTPEILALCRLRQWAADRAHMKTGHVSDYRRQGWRERRSRECDSRIVRVVDFERALDSLTPDARALLVLTYRDGFDQRTIAEATHISPRAQTYKLAAARLALAAALDSLDLL